MIKNKRVLAIIPARSGSKGLPGKNMRLLCGRPLLAWSIDAGKSSKYIDDLIVSTDSINIREFAINCGAQAPFLRPSFLAEDESKTIDVVFHAINFMSDKFKVKYEYIVLLEPTSPIRDDKDIDNMIEALELNSADSDSIISVGEVGIHPSIVKKISERYIEPYCPSLPQHHRRQDNVPAFFPFCVAYIAKNSALKEQKTFYTDKSIPYVIKRDQCYEIDDIYDFICVEAVLKNRGLV